MKLRSQMLLVGVMTLAVPLVGWQSVEQLYASLQRTRIDEQNLKVANMRLALSESDDVRQSLETGLKIGETDHWYAEDARFPIFIDGYEDDWQTLVSGPQMLEDHGTGQTPRLRMAVHSDRLYLFLSVVDDAVVHHLPPVIDPDRPESYRPDRQAALVNGDSVELLMQHAQTNGAKSRWQHALIRSIAPGSLETLRASDTVSTGGQRLPAGATLPDWESVWVQTETGFQVEMSLPLPAAGSVMALAVVDVDHRGEPRRRWAGNMSPGQMASVHRQQGPVGTDAGSRLLLADPAVRQRLDAWTTPGNRSRLFDVQGRLLADVNRLYDPNQPEELLENPDLSSEGIWDALLLRVFAFFVAGDLPLMSDYSGKAESLHLEASQRASVHGREAMTSRYVSDENDRVLGSLAALGSDPRRGYLLYESNEEHASAYAGSEMARLFSLLLLVSLLAGSGLLIFAVVLSSRIRRLSQQAQLAVAADGRVMGLPGSEARDEIGDLSRKLSSLLARSAAYTQYLEALSGRLSHELRTPLSVVRTSIENIDRDRLDEQSLMLIDRASGGADHLGSIIRALVESTRLEQSVQMADMQRVALGEWLQGSLLRYRQIHPGRHFEMDMGSDADLVARASPELLSQAFDKLVDNAVSFAQADPIVLGLHVRKSSEDRSASGDQAILTVANKGELLDESTLSRLFDPMYSDRPADLQIQTHELHLGLGLYIVKMIADVHDGAVVARNDPDGVRVGLCLPVS